MESAVRIPGYNKPEPDHSIVRGESDDYTDRHPEPADVGLIVEIADSSLSRDRGEKRDLYARAGIPVYWIVDLAARQVEVHRPPVAGVYPPPSIFNEARVIDLVLDGILLGQITIADLLPKQP